MATKKVSISIDEDDVLLMQAAADLAGMKFSPYLVRCARLQVLREEAERQARHDNLRDHEAEARELLAEQQATEAADKGHQGHAA